MSSILNEPAIRLDRGVPIYTVRWPAIFAGVAVGLSLHLVLMLIGIAAGLTALDQAAEGDVRADGRSAAMVAAAWNGISMLIAAFVGGYVAARASGLRRSSDGVLHGVVSWAATTILTAILATSLFTSAMSGMFGILRDAAGPAADAARSAAPAAGQAGAATAEIAGMIREGRRDEAIQTLQSRYGMSPERARGVVDSLAVATGQPQQVDPRTREQARVAAEEAAERGAQAGWALVAAIVLSLILAMIGGAIGTRAAGRRLNGAKVKARRAVPPAADTGVRTDRVVVR
jgi:hypothetical protein